MWGWGGALPYYFFLSYARGTIDDEVEQFFKDLSAQVRDLAGVSRNEEVGFLDRHNIVLGARWPDQLVTALSDCSTFIALTMPRYFNSEACGKEWWVFEERLRRYEENTRGNAPMLIPLIWVPSSRMPERALIRQYDHERLDPAYHEDGLRQLMRLTDQRNAYIRAVSLLAKHIVDQAGSHSLPSHAGPLEFNEIPNAFAAPSVAAPHGETAKAEQPSPPTSRYVHFVIAAPSRKEASAAKLRNDLSFYGNSRPDWAPYEPPLAIAESARTVASEQSFECAVASIERLPERMQFAKENNQLIVFLVDAWATKLTDHRRALLDVDTWEESPEETETSAVMIPCSAEDDETRQHWRDLSYELRKTFVSRFARSDDRMFRPSVLSLPAFEADLRVALSVAQNRMHVKGVPHQPLPEDAGSPPRPVLDLSALPGT
ncbi:MAG TPA: hypothetical protein DGT23_23120 [Micromonosporaceae bacterium]|nr:hypothetical protein [Micromonosporaceae bacterium]